MNKVALYEYNIKSTELRSAWYEDMATMYLANRSRQKHYGIQDVVPYKAISPVSRNGDVAQWLEVLSFVDRDIEKVTVLITAKRGELWQYHPDFIASIVDTILALRLDDITIKLLEQLNALVVTGDMIHPEFREIERMHLITELSITSTQNSSNVLDVCWDILSSIIPTKRRRINARV